MDPLDRLRDLHVPEAVSWWPPAPGWWVLGLGIIGLTCLALWWRHRRSLLAPRRLALAELRHLRATYEIEHQAVSFTQGLSTLLRRYALACFPRHKVAGLVGYSWLQFLDKTGNTRDFTEGPGSRLVDFPYQHTIQGDLDAVATVVESWIKQVRKVKG